jgi:hypothetical protein
MIQAKADISIPMSGFRGNADVMAEHLECPLIAKSRHLPKSDIGQSKVDPKRSFASGGVRIDIGPSACPHGMSPSRHDMAL